VLRRIGYGVVAWAIPYVTSLALLPLIQSDHAMFKTIMIVEGSLTGAILTVVYFESVTSKYLKEGLLLGATWIVVNWLLDIVGVVPFAKLTFDRYFIEIGFEYFAMFAPTLAIGYVLERRLVNQTLFRSP
jgi:hypothetical protein